MKLHLMTRIKSINEQAFIMIRLDFDHFPKLSLKTNFVGAPYPLLRSFSRYIFASFFLVFDTLIEYFYTWRFFSLPFLLHP